MERERILTDEGGVIGSDQLPADQTLEDGTDLRPELIRDQLEQGSPGEDLPHHGRAVDHSSLFRVEPIQARTHQGVDRRRYRGNRDLLRRSGAVRSRERAVVAQHLDHLDQEEWIPTPHLRDPPPQLAGEIVSLEKFIDEVPRLHVAERGEVEHRGVGQSSGPFGSLFEQVASSEAEQEDGRISTGSKEMVEEVEERRLGPLEIIEDQDEWAPS